MTASQPTAERLSLLVGLAVLMLATLPRYVAGGHATRLNLILVALVVVMVVAVVHWRMLAEASRRRLPELFKQLVICLGAGLAGMGAWHAVFTDWLSWQLLISHGATLGLLLHALWCWIKTPKS